MERRVEDVIRGFEMAAFEAMPNNSSYQRKVMRAFVNNLREAVDMLPHTMELVGGEVDYVLNTLSKVHPMTHIMNPYAVIAGMAAVRIMRHNPDGTALTPDIVSRVKKLLSSAENPIASADVIRYALLFQRYGS